jgi:hypothetical protein
LSSVSTPAGDKFSEGCRLIEVRVSELRQLFNSIDPSPFRERDLDPRAEEFIAEWARDSPADAPLGLMVYLERPSEAVDEGRMLADAVHTYFAQRAAQTRRSLRDLFRRGRVSLVIGLVFLASSLFAGDVLAAWLAGDRLSGIIRESFVIGGWVAMWRPLEVFLYDWWPIRAESRLYDRLSVMPVQIARTPASTTDRDQWTNPT